MPKAEKPPSPHLIILYFFFSLLFFLCYGIAYISLARSQGGRGHGGYGWREGGEWKVRWWNPIPMEMGSIYLPTTKLSQLHPKKSKICSFHPKNSWYHSYAWCLKNEEWWKVDLRQLINGLALLSTVQQKPLSSSLNPVQCGDASWDSTTRVTTTYGVEEYSHYYVTNTKIIPHIHDPKSQLSFL